MDKKVRISALVLLGFFCAQAAQAISLGGRFSVFAAGGYNFYSIANPAEDSQELHKLPGGGQFGGGFQYGLLDNLLIGFSALRVAAETRNVILMDQVGEDGSGNFILVPGQVEFTTAYPAWELGVTLKGALPVGEDFLLTGGFEAAALFFTATESMRFINPAWSSGVPDTTEPGLGLGLNLLIGTEYFLLPQLSLGLDLGYRFTLAAYMTQRGTNAQSNLNYNSAILNSRINFYFGP